MASYFQWSFFNISQPFCLIIPDIIMETLLSLEHSEYACKPDNKALIKCSDEFSPEFLKCFKQNVLDAVIEITKRERWKPVAIGKTLRKISIFKIKLVKMSATWKKSIYYEKCKLQWYLQLLIFTTWQTTFIRIT